MTPSNAVTIVRNARRVLAPASVRCGLCKLSASDNEVPPGVVHFEVRYNGDEGMPENPLSALTRSKYVCDSCVVAIAVMRKAVELPLVAVAVSDMIDTTDSALRASAHRAINAVAGRYQEEPVKTAAPKIEETAKLIEELQLEREGATSVSGDELREILHRLVEHS